VAVDENVTFEERYCNAANNTENEMEDWKQPAKQLQHHQELSLTDPEPTTKANKIYSGIPKDNKTGDIYSSGMSFRMVFANGFTNNEFDRQEKGLEGRIIIGTHPIRIEVTFTLCCSVAQ
jgi:hypothetical protein